MKLVGQFLLVGSQLAHGCFGAGCAAASAGLAGSPALAVAAIACPAAASIMPPKIACQPEQALLLDMDMSHLFLPPVAAEHEGGPIDGR